MPSQFFGLSIASSGLRAANAAQNTAANNISNAQTEGYSRQQVSQEATNALRVFATYGCAGAGVDTVAIERVRDVFYDTRYRNNNVTMGEYDIKNYYMNTLQDYLEDDGKSGFSSIFTEMSKALQSIATNSNSTSSKKQFIAAAQSLAEYFNNTAGNLRELQKDMNAEIKLRTDRINTIASEIATLNKQINVVEMTSGTANALRDKRDLLLDELSQIVDIKTEENKITDANDPTRETGGTNFIVYIAGGQTLVNGNDYNTLECRSRASNEKLHMTDADGLYDIFWSNGNEFNVNNPSMGGQLKGLIAMRDGNNNQSFQGKVTGVGRSADGKDAVVSVKVNLEYLKSMNKCNLADKGGSITLGNTVYYYKSWEYDEATDTYTFQMDDSKCDTIVGADKVGKEAEVGADVKYQGIPYYLEQMNEFVRAFSTKVNEIFMSGYDKAGNQGAMFFTATTKDSNKAGSQYDITDFTDANGYYEMNAFNFTVNSALIENADLLGTRAKGNDEEAGPEECGKVDELIEALRDKSKFSFRNATAGEFLDCVLSDVALNGKSAKTFYDTYKGIAVTIDNQRTSISGVDEDEEATNLVKHQYSYTLASKMIQTLTEMYDQLILQTGV